VLCGSSGAEPQWAEVLAGVCLRSLRDYSRDNRGDVGSWVRESAMTGLQSLLIALTRTGMCLQEGFVVFWLAFVCIDD
jgi:hypothetical protein